MRCLYPSATKCIFDSVIRPSLTILFISSASIPWQQNSGSNVYSWPRWKAKPISKRVSIAFSVGVRGAGWACDRSPCILIACKRLMICACAIDWLIETVPNPLGHQYFGARACVCVFDSRPEIFPLHCSSHFQKCAPISSFISVGRIDFKHQMAVAGQSECLLFLNSHKSEA